MCGTSSAFDIDNTYNLNVGESKSDSSTTTTDRRDNRDDDFNAAQKAELAEFQGLWGGVLG